MSAKTLSRGCDCQTMLSKPVSASSNRTTVSASAGDVARYKQAVRVKFDKRTRYDANNTIHPAQAAELVRRAGLQPGDKVLDLACGTGLVSFLAAEKVGPAGSVIGVDISPGLLQQVSH